MVKLLCFTFVYFLLFVIAIVEDVVLQVATADSGRFNLTSPYAAGSNVVHFDLTSVGEANRLSDHIAVTFDSAVTFVLVIVSNDCVGSCVDLNLLTVGIFEKLWRKEVLLRTNGMTYNPQKRHNLQAVYPVNSSSPIIVKFLISPPISNKLNVTFIPAFDKDSCSNNGKSFVHEVQFDKPRFDKICLRCISHQEIVRFNLPDYLNTESSCDPVVQSGLLSNCWTILAALFVSLLILTVLLYALCRKNQAALKTEVDMEKQYELEAVPLVPFQEWITAESQKCPRKLVDLLCSQDSDHNLLLKFLSTYKILRLYHEGKTFQATQLVMKDEAKYQLEKRRIYELQLDSNWSFYVYELPCKKRSSTTLYLIEEMPCHRLVDQLKDFNDSKRILQLLLKLVETFCRDRENQMIQFRPDLVFLDDKKEEVFMNHFIPNLDDFPFMMRDGRIGHSLIHPHLRHHSRAPQLLSEVDRWAQFIYSVGWMVWIVVEGSGGVSPQVASEQVDTERWLQSLQSGERSFPEYLREVMRKCWTVDWTNSTPLKMKSLWEGTRDKLRIQLWITIQSHECPTDIKQMISQINTDTTPLLKFSQTLTVFFLTSPSGKKRYHATQILKQDGLDHYLEEKRRIFDLKHGGADSNWSFNVWESDDESKLYVIERAGHKRWIDHLGDIKSIQSFVKKLWDKFDAMGRRMMSSGFALRPDCAFLDDNKEDGAVVDFNLFVMSHSESQLVLKNGRRVETFHLHPRLRHKSATSLNEEECRIQLIYSFGWFVWILLEGSGNRCPDEKSEEVTPDKWLQLLAADRAASYPEYLRDVMRQCWKETTLSHHQDWGEVWWTILDSLNINLELRGKLTYDATVCEWVKEQCSNDDKLILKLSGPIKVFALSGKVNQNRLRDELHATQIINVNTRHYLAEKKRILQLVKEMKERSGGFFYFYEERDAVSFFVVHKMSHRKLMDHLNEFDPDQMKECVHKLGRNFDVNIQSGSLKGFLYRPDNVFLTEDDKTFVFNPFITNDLHSPIFMTQLTQQHPFHLHPRLQSANNLITSVEECRIQLIYSFGWVVWILLEGSGNRCPPVVDGQEVTVDKWLQLLSAPDDGTSNYAESLRDVMRQCWSVCDRETEEDIVSYWERIVNSMK